MNAFLMYRDRDSILTKEQSPNTADLVQDLELKALFHGMAQRDPFLLEVVQCAVLSSLDEPDAIVYRQSILLDCVENSGTVKELYGIAVNALDCERSLWGWMFSKSADGTVHRSIDALRVLLEHLVLLRTIGNAHRSEFLSEGFCRFFAMLTDELKEEYLQTVNEHLQALAFRGDIVMSGGLGQGNRISDVVLHKPPKSASSWLHRLSGWLDDLVGSGREAYVYELNERDEAGFRALSDLRARALSETAVTLAQSADHMRKFFSTLRLELGFYLGCLNLRDLMTQRHAAFCIPEPISSDQMVLSGRGLYDLSLLLNTQSPVTGNDIEADGTALVMITGANRGGKSTFMRAIGIAQLMLQCGMFVPAQSHRANVCRGLFTHFKREEDRNLKLGKFDEELSRLSAIIDRLEPGSMVLLNEALASTNEREGAEIAGQVIMALLDSHIKVFYVTHMADLAQGLYRANLANALFLRAERLPDGKRTFRMLPAEPQTTSYAVDLYRHIFEFPPA